MIRVFVNGTFDIIHTGHIELLNYAKSLGDVLTVGIDSDSRVQELKGAARPINTQQERKLLLENLKAVDSVHIFHNDQELINLIRNADIMVKGSDYRGTYIIGQDQINKLVFFERINGYSTTEKIQHIINR